MTLVFSIIAHLTILSKENFAINIIITNVISPVKLFYFPTSYCVLVDGFFLFLTHPSPPRCEFLFTPLSGLLQSKVVGWQSIGAYDKGLICNK